MASDADRYAHLRASPEFAVLHKGQILAGPELDLALDGAMAGRRVVPHAGDAWANTRAFLSVLAHSEGTDRDIHGHSLELADQYRVCYGYDHMLTDWSDHPSITKEWRGKRLPAEMCRKAGFEPGCKSTAAGRYQINRPTWLECRSGIELPDFSPDSQDKAAIHLLRVTGALPHVEAGRFDAAVHACRARWASLPGSGWGQPERRLADLRAVFVRNMGVLV